MSQFLQGCLLESYRNQTSISIKYLMKDHVFQALMSAFASDESTVTDLSLDNNEERTSYYTESHIDQLSSALSNNRSLRTVSNFV
jgi:hypothetical protein